METLNETYTYAVGRRKESLAKVRLFLGAGQITVNGKPIAEYFPGLIFQKLYSQPFEVTSTMGKFTISIKVVGGGKMSQLGAIIHGISRVLAKIEDKKLIEKKKKEFSVLGKKVFVISLYDDESVKIFRDELVKILKKKV